MWDKYWDFDIAFLVGLAFGKLVIMLAHCWAFILPTQTTEIIIHVVPISNFTQTQYVILLPTTWRSYRDHRLLWRQCMHPVCNSVILECSTPQSHSPDVATARWRTWRIAWSVSDVTLTPWALSQPRCFSNPQQVCWATSSSPTYRYIRSLSIRDEIKTRIPSGIWSRLLPAMCERRVSSQNMVKSLTLNPYMSLFNLKLWNHIWSTNINFRPPPYIGLFGPSWYELSPYGWIAGGVGWAVTFFVTDEHKRDY